MTGKAKYYHPEPMEDNHESIGTSTRTIGKSNKTSVLSTLTSIGIFIIFIIAMGYLGPFLEQQALNSIGGGEGNKLGEGDRHAVDPFDRIFGSEFSHKFKNNTRNRGTLDKEREEKERIERARKNFRKKGITSTASQICQTIRKEDRENLNILLRFAANDIEEGLRLLKTSDTARKLFSLTFQGYTFREILNDTENQTSLNRIRLASAYILDCVITNHDFKNMEVTSLEGGTSV